MFLVSRISPVEHSDASVSPTDSYGMFSITTDHIRPLTANQFRLHDLNAEGNIYHFTTAKVPVDVSSTRSTFSLNDVRWVISTLFNLLKTKPRLLYLKTQFAPRSKHFSSVIKTNQFTM